MPSPATQEAIAVSLVIQYALVRESLERLLSTGLGFKVAGQCASTQEGLDLLKHEPVDVVLLDLDFGREAAEQFVHIAKKRGYKGKIVLLATDGNHGDIADFIRAGVCGVFQKCDPAALLGHGIRDVVAGNVWFTQEQLETALRGSAAPATNGAGRFTQREQSVLALVAEGLTNREIGARIGVSEGSVKATVQQLFGKLGVRSRSRLVRIAMERQEN